MMKVSIAFLLVLTTFSSGAFTQTPRSSQSKPRSETIRICQGVAIPEGYVIVEYMTASTCPHGAYLLKKQAAYDISLTANNGRRQPVAATSTAPGRPSQPARKSAGTASGSYASATTRMQPSEDPGNSTTASAS